MNFIDMFGAYLGVITMGFMVLPAFQVLEWRKRGSAEGFSSIHFVLPCLMMACWFKHGLLTNDPVNINLNAFSLALSAFYIVCFAYYAPERKNLFLQLLGLFTILGAIFGYVGTLAVEEAPDTMGKIAAVAQNAGLFGGIYQLKQVFDTKTTEYVPASMQFGIMFIVGQWTLFGILSGNYYMAIGNVPGLLLCAITIAMYYVYPPITWRVPIIGTQQKAKDVKAE